MLLDTTESFGAEFHALLKEASARGPVAVDGATGATVVLRHADIEALARDRRLAGVGLAMFDLMGIDDGLLRSWYGSLMFTNDGAVHDRLRSLVSRAFTPRAVERLRADAAALATDALDQLRREGEDDLVGALGQLPMRVMCRLLGVPDADVADFAAWADALSPVFGVMQPEQIEAATSAIVDLLAYVDRLTDARRADPADDLVTRLLAAEDEGERLTHDELVIMVANLLVGGHDTTASQLGCTLLCLLEHPGETKRVRDDRSLLGSAVAETIRFEPSIPAVPRTATEPVDVGDTTVPAGGLVLLMTAAANREPGVWREPDVLDVGRFTDQAAPRLLSFGAGPHYCLGAALARMTVEEAVAAALDLGDGLAPVDDLGQVEWRVVLGRSPARLRVSLVR